MLTATDPTKLSALEREGAARPNLLRASRSLTAVLIAVGRTAAIVLAILTAAWMGSSIAVPAPAADASLAVKLRHVVDHPVATFVGPALAVGIAPLHVLVWSGLAAFVWPRRPASSVFAVSFGLIYAPLASVHDWAELTVVRGLAGVSQTDPAAAEAAYRFFESPGGLVSFAHGIDVLAHVIWGLAALSMAGGLLAFRDRLAQVTAGLFALGGMLALAGGIGFVVQVPALEPGVLASGVTFLLAMLLSALLLRRAQE